MRPIFRSKNELVYDSLKEAILHGELKPGQRLIIDELAADMGVSQIPVREALRQLEADGFVRIEPYVGASVTPLHASFITEVFALLQALEIVSSRAAAHNISPGDLEALERRVLAMDSITADPDHWSHENKMLHLFICQCAGMSLVGSMMATAFDHWDRLRRTYLQDVFGHRIGLAQEQHHHMLAGFRARDPDMIERVIREHNQSALAAYVKQLHSGPETGDNP